MFGKFKRIILVGKGGSGKDFFRKKLESRGFRYAVSFTTRPPREGEQYGKDYYFISDQKCEMMSQNDEWYELVSFNGWNYGTAKTQFYSGDCPVFIMTPSGLAHVKPEDRPECFVIFIDPPQDVISERLRARNMPGDSAERRIQADIELFIDFKDYDVRITNPDF